MNLPNLAGEDLMWLRDYSLSKPEVVRVRLERIASYLERHNEAADDRIKTVEQRVEEAIAPFVFPICRAAGLGDKVYSEQVCKIAAAALSAAYETRSV